MTGSSLLPIVVPIVATIALAVWLAIVFYAAAHPEWKRHRTSSDTGPAEAEAHPAEEGGAPGRKVVAAAGHAAHAVPQGEHNIGAPAPSASPRRAA